MHKSCTNPCTFHCTTCTLRYPRQCMHHVLSTTSIILNTCKPCLHVSTWKKVAISSSHTFVRPLDGKGTIFVNVVLPHECAHIHTHDPWTQHSRLGLCEIVCHTRPHALVLWRLPWRLFAPSKSVVEPLNQPWLHILVHPCLCRLISLRAGASSRVHTSTHSCKAVLCTTWECVPPQQRITREFIV